MPNSARNRLGHITHYSGGFNPRTVNHSVVIDVLYWIFERKNNKSIKGYPFLAFWAQFLPIQDIIRCCPFMAVDTAYLQGYVAHITPA
jgi:hypothetical protein